MSATHAHTVAYVAPTQLEAEPPPNSRSGAVGWMRDNLFSTRLNVALTIACALLLVWLVPPLVDWAIVKSVWTAQSLSECRQIIATRFGEGADGACWAVVRERFGQLVYGFYPAELRWRPNVAAVLLVTALAPVLFRNLRPFAWGMGLFAAAAAVLALLAPAGAGGTAAALAPAALVAIAASLAAGLFGGPRQRPRWLLFTLAYPVVAYVLLWGGVGLAPVQTSKFGGFLLTLVIGVTGIAASLPIGILLALGRRSRLPILTMMSVAFIEFIRGVPLITLLFVASTLLNYFLPPGTSFDLILRVVIMVTLFASAYMAEVVRGGLAALPRGQYEAADTLGLTYWQSMRLVILPQALKISIPGIVNTFIGLFKDTTLVAVIGLLDPLGMTNPIRSDSDWNGIVWELYGFIALLFFICCWSMSRYSMHLERRLRAADRR